MTLRLLLFFLFCSAIAQAQHSIARQWNEKVLEAISGDFARPTVHARNLFHTSVAMYDAWAVYSGTADTYLLGKKVHGFKSSLAAVPQVNDVKAAQEAAISYAVFRLLKHRFKKSPRADLLFEDIDNFMVSLGYDPDYTSTNYACGPAAMGNHIAQTLIEYGLQDGSNEADGYKNQYYEPVNPAMSVALSGNPNVLDLNRWQPLQIDQIIDQSGNPIAGGIQPFLSPEWGNVQPFSLKPSDATVYNRDGHDYIVYLDPGAPAQLDTAAQSPASDEYKWNHELVAVWSSHLDPNDGVLWDISPASIGNIQSYPTDFASYQSFYDLENGGDPSPGHPLNPKTGLPYAPQIVPRGDYARVLAEFWADGPSSATPPGHWFEIWNYVNDQPIQRKWRGEGPVLDLLEWDVKSYLVLGGAMHDCAITAWGIKGWYDSSRPITALRGMAELGQSSDPNLPNYHPGGLPLIPGFIELIEAGDSLQGQSGQYIGEVKMRAWRGPNYISNPASDDAGVGWIRAKFWWSYQRPTFVSPPFGGFISGHSTYSRAGAEVLTAVTGDPYFPGGMGTFNCPKNEFLVFEDGPSEGLTLQWATYRDASDQCSLSRIWGGIHPPMDDIPGRLIGMKIGPAAVAFAEQFFTKTDTTSSFVGGLNFYPNPANCLVQVEYVWEDGKMPVDIYAMDGRHVKHTDLNFNNNRALLDIMDLTSGMYIVVGRDKREGNRIFEEKVVRY
ncbi:MAG: T9SS type A sorting domain-containing protein [Saprospiraceae bacterium]|nr:T9SS type A sorting domain-containing protein [Saprospiraceae bacterium]MCF8252315.1 T9SS type A sorting domain-containing protein [Saprospiraceae bacterium]MCF8282154.1 T9SS type A sorting domain-containing protein [Bacteroidales bacterium]MCF8313958.1 T9SS type A sorting domain-containing protein [Saprospiraceae bacterium]MCF8442667.1 T9SS type A sorting domain-containing protein [Saprospiraceae bacterium]